MILSARDLKVTGVLCTLRFVHVVDFSMSRGECGMPTAPGLPLSVTLTGDVFVTVWTSRLHR